MTDTPPVPRHAADEGPVPPTGASEAAAATEAAGASEPAAVPPPSPAKRRSPRRSYRRPLLALPAMIGLGLVAAFFAWQAAEPLWLAMGRGVAGTATVTRCDALGGQPLTTDAAVTDAAGQPTYSCVVFTEATGAFQAVDVDLRAAGGSHRIDGASTPARMLSATHDRAWADHRAGFHLRWVIGFALVLACGAAVAWVSGANRLEDRRARQRALAWSLAGPLLIAAGFLAAAF